MAAEIVVVADIVAEAEVAVAAPIRHVPGVVRILAVAETLEVILVIRILN